MLPEMNWPLSLSKKVRFKILRSVSPNTSLTCVRRYMQNSTSLDDIWYIRHPLRKIPWKENQCIEAEKVYLLVIFINQLCIHSSLSLVHVIWNIFYTVLNICLNHKDFIILRPNVFKLIFIIMLLLKGKVYNTNLI